MLTKNSHGTSDVCQPLDGLKVPKDKMVFIPPLHPHCRTIIHAILSFEDDVVWGDPAKVDPVVTKNGEFGLKPPEFIPSHLSAGNVYDEYDKHIVNFIPDPDELLIPYVQEAYNLGVEFADYHDSVHVARTVNDGLRVLKEKGIPIDKMRIYISKKYFTSNDYSPAKIDNNSNDIKLNPFHRWWHDMFYRKDCFLSSQYSSENIYHPLFHEVGHSLNRVRRNMNLHSKDYIDVVEFNKVARLLSNQATLSIWEYIAEMFSVIVTGEIETFKDKDILMIWYNKYGG